jgi:uncharacterized protein
LGNLGGAVVAFSGGVDSSVLVVLAHNLLGIKAVAATADSPGLPRSDRSLVARFCDEHGIAHRFVDTGEFQDPAFLSNPVDRCYYCKQHLYERLIRLADELGFESVVEGTNASDLDDHRPGYLALQQWKRVVTPLVQADMTKEDVRRLAQELGLATWDKPATACLASRVPPGLELTTELMRRIDSAEDTLRALGVGQVRVRHHGDVARIEVDRADMRRCLDRRQEIAASLAKIGWRFITLDLLGYRTGGARL